MKTKPEIEDVKIGSQVTEFDAFEDQIVKKIAETVKLPAPTLVYPMSFEMIKTKAV